MIEQLNRQRVLNMLETFYSGDIEGALARCSDDVDYIASAPIDILPHMGHRRGKAEVRQMWQTVHARYSGLRHELAAIVAEGDKVVARVKREPDAAIMKIVSGWPTRFDAKRALALGFKVEKTFDEIIRAHVDDELGGKIAA